MRVGLIGVGHWHAAMHAAAARAAGAEVPPVWDAGIGLAAAFAATLDDGARRVLLPLPPATRYGLNAYMAAMRLIDQAYGVRDR